MEDLERRFRRSLVLIDYPDNSRVTLEIACSSIHAAQKLQDEFGGKILRLEPDWLQGFSKENRKKPLRIGSRLIVFNSPNQARPSSSRNVHSIVIPAEAAFGTGEHATTAMCLRLLERYTRSCQGDWKMLDAGTGSGILAIAGSYFGAGRVLAIDTDPLACKTAKRNARLNGSRKIIFFQTNIFTHKFRETFDIIVANLFSQVLIEALPIWRKHLSPEGKLIFSGILRTQERETFRAVRDKDFRISDICRRGKWVAAVAQRRSKRVLDRAAHV